MPKSIENENAYHGVALIDSPSYSFPMNTIRKVKEQALKLNEQERAALAANLLHSLPPILADDDYGVAEALRRDAEIQADSSQSMSLEDLNTIVKNRRRR